MHLNCCTKRRNIKVLLSFILIISSIVSTSFCYEDCTSCITSKQALSLANNIDVSKYESNCVSVAFAYDTRLRYGLDNDYVRPTATEKGMLNRKDVCGLFEGKISFVKVNPYDCTSYIQKTFPKGSHGFISGRYYRDGKVIGHLFNFAVCDDGVLLIDADFGNVVLSVTQEFVEETYFNIAVLRTDTLTPKLEFYDYINLIGE